MRRSGYKSYHGRRSGGHNKLVLLLVLALVAACAALFIQKYMTYSDDGGLHLEIPLPWHDREPEKPAPPKEPEDMNLVIEKPQPMEPELLPEEPEPVPTYTPRHLLDLSLLPQEPEALASALEKSGANGFVCTVKNNAGQVLYRLPSAMNSAVIKGAPEGETLAPLCQLEGVTAVARINCFHDSYYAWANMETAGLCQSTGYIWYDNMSYHWLDPTKETARRYIIDLCLDCAQLGFDELLLEEMSYPHAGKLQKIDYREANRPLALESFLTELREALAPYQIKVSLLLPEGLFSTDSASLVETTGQSLGLLPLADSVYVATQQPEAIGAQLRSTGEDEYPDLVVVDSAPDPLGEGSWYQPAP